MNNVRFKDDTSTTKQLDRLHNSDGWELSYALSASDAEMQNFENDEAESTDMWDCWLMNLHETDSQRSLSYATQVTKSPYDNIVKPFSGSQELIQEFQQLHSLRDGWDGPESQKPKESTIFLAWRLFLNLPFGASAPELSASADGELSLFWHSEKGFGSATINSDDKLVYFVQAGESTAKDRVAFIGDSIPHDLAIALKGI